MNAAWSLALLWPAVALSSTAGDRPVRVLQSDGQGLVVELLPKYYEPSKIIISGKEYLRYDFAASRVDESQRPGLPELRYQSITVRLPGMNNTTIEILRADYEDEPNVALAPMPGLREGEVDPVPVYRLDPAAYSGTAFLPEKAAALVNVGTTRQVILGELRFYPLQYQAATQTLRKYSRLVVRVNYGTREGSAATSDRLLDGVALNGDAFTTSAAGSPLRKQRAVRNSVLAAGIWYRFPVTEDGMYKMDGQTLLNLGIPSSVDPHTIRIFGNGGYQLPLDITAPFADDLQENAVYVFDGGTTGQLDPSDYIVFYGKGTRGWNYTPASKSFSHYIDHYTEVNYCWLAYGTGAARAMTQVASLSQSGPYHPVIVTGKIFREDEKVNILSSGLEWVGQPLNIGDNVTYVHALNAPDPAQPINYVFRIGARSNGNSTFTIDDHGQRIATVGLPATVVDDYFSIQFVNSTVSRQQVPPAADGRVNLRFGFTSANSSGSGYIDWYEIFYRQLLSSQGNVFNFHSIDTTAVAQYDVTGFSTGQIFVFDVSKYDSALVITGPRISADTCSFQTQLSSGSVKQFFVVGSDGFKSPAGFTRVANQNLHGDTVEAPYIIISHPDFMAAAQRLKSFRELPGTGYLKTLLVDVNQIYNEFGGGVATPVALRNYLRYVSNNWAQPPKYALLFGDGDYDYKRIISSGTNWIPPWETFESFWPLYTYASEDDFVTFTASRRIELGLGRLAARSPGEANTMVDKIIEYEAHPVNDPWKIRVTIVADDGLAGAGTNDLFLHTRQAESIANLVPPLFEKRKIFLYDYPTVITPSGRRKPEVNAAIINAINQGTLVVNFTGHGNPRVWTHEQVFVRETDFPALTNRGKYFFLVAATCNYSLLDMIHEQSGGEQLMTQPDAGAIGVLSATRPVFAGDNFSLNETVYDYLFQRDNAGNLLQQRAGDVMYKTKQIHFGPGSTADNDRKFFLLGDPALRIGFPPKFATIDSVNNVAATNIVQMQALSHVSVKASVHDSTASDRDPFDGQSQVVVFDANRKVLLVDSIEVLPNLFQRVFFSYTAAGNTLFRGEQSVRNGTISANFIVPKDISYANDFGRMTVYFWNSSSDGAGYTTNFRVGGTDSTAPPDTRGPSVQLYIDSRGFRSGDVVSASPVLLADLSDSSGINTSGAGIGHRLEAWLDNAGESVDLSDYYRSKSDTYREGTVSYPLGALSQGTHKLRLRAWDTYNNSSAGETLFDVVSGVGLRLSNVFNFPNPFRSSTVFTFEHNQLAVIDAEVKIYTVAGRLIQSIKKTNIAEPFVQMPWDGMDRDGDQLANGVYLYKVIARTQDSRFTSEALGKLSIAK